MINSNILNHVHSASKYDGFLSKYLLFTTENLSHRESNRKVSVS